MAKKEDVTNDDIIKALKECEFDKYIDIYKDALEEKLEETPERKSKSVKKSIAKKSRPKVEICDYCKEPSNECVCPPVCVDCGKEIPAKDPA